MLQGGSTFEARRAGKLFSEHRVLQAAFGSSSSASDSSRRLLDAAMREIQLADTLQLFERHTALASSQRRDTSICLPPRLK